MRMRNEDVVETSVRIHSWQREAGIVRMLQLEGVNIARVQHGLNRPPAHAAAAEPDERFQTERQFVHVELFSRRDGVEVAGEHVKALSMLFDALEQLAQLQHTPSLR